MKSWIKKRVDRKREEKKELLKCYVCINLLYFPVHKFSDIFKPPYPSRYGLNSTTTVLLQG